MDGYAASLPDRLANVDDALAREFETHLAESATLAFRVAYGVLRHRQDAEDVAQEAVAKAYRSFHRLRDRSRFRSWLVRMTWRLALDCQRNGRRRLLRDGAQAVAESEAPHHDPVTRERQRMLWRAIEALPERLRVVLVLASIEGHDLREVAALLRIPEGTVKSRLFTARQRLKEQLK